MKQMAYLAVTSIFLASILFAGTGLASTTCKVVSVQGDNVTLDCGDDAGDYKAGMKVSIKKKKARKAIEGC